MQLTVIIEKISFKPCNEVIPIVEPIPQTEPAKPPLYFGYGKCSRYGCACIAFEADTGASVCNTCHHSYSDHW